MKRGFPRPMTKVGELDTRMLSSDIKSKYENKLYPHPYSARDDEISKLHDGRVGHCITQGMCIVCGDWVEPDAQGEVWVYTNTGMLMEDSGPFHEKCMRLTIAMCPVVHERQIVQKAPTYQWEKRRWNEVAPLIRGKHIFTQS